MSLYGTIVKFDAGRGFGFIRPNKKGDDLFFHRSDVVHGEPSSLNTGAQVSFQIGEGPKGPKAVKIEVLRQAVSPYRFYVGALIFVGVAAFVGTQILLPTLSPLVSYAIAVNIAAFVLAGFDKSISAGGTLRVPEWVLLGGAAVGGSLGLLLGMRMFRHKIRKAQFQFMLVLILIAQIFLIRALLTAAES